MADTEIDYSTYMQQAQVFLKGERVYENIKGETGPCVYPALHLYLSSLLSFCTNRGTDIKRAQFIYLGIYTICQVAVMATYKAAQIPPVFLPLLIMSKRLHSIFVLRLFNDCWAMTFFYIGVTFMCKGRWRLGSTFYSLALAVKMNILLYAPAMTVVYLRALGLQRSVLEAFRVILIQGIIAFPFLRQDARSYITSAFNLSRVFLYKWTVNLRFLDEAKFLDKRLAKGLLTAHLIIILTFIFYRWTGISKTGSKWIKANVAPPNKSIERNKRLPSGRFIITSLYTSNLIGITFSRSLHYQFYSWYAHQIPLLVFLSSLPNVVKIAIPLFIEIAWNTFPSTSKSSLLLLYSHLVLLLGLWRAKQDDSILDQQRPDEDEVAEEIATKWDHPKIASKMSKTKVNKKTIVR